MGKIVESIQRVVASTIRAHKGEMSFENLDDRAAVQLGIILTLGALEVVAANSARRESKTPDGAEANRALAGDVQRRMEQQIVDLCGLEVHAAAMLISDVLRGANCCQPDLKTLRHEMLADEP
jgi:hypothetical protein